MTAVFAHPVGIKGFDIVRSVCCHAINHSRLSAKQILEVLYILFRDLGEIGVAFQFGVGVGGVLDFSCCIPSDNGADTERSCGRHSSTVGDDGAQPTLRPGYTSPSEGN